MLNTKKKRQIQLVVRDRMNSVCPMNFFRTTDTTDTTIWKPGLIESLFKPNRIQISRAIGNHRATRTPRRLGYLTSFFLHSVLLLLEVEQSHGNIIFHSTRDIKG